MAYKLLVVDDESNIVDILRFNLEKEGYEVHTAENGKIGYEVFKREHPDLLLLDIMMPELDGFGLCKMIREESNVPIIMLTARAEEVDKVLGLEFGADDYITKPFSVRELVARVKANLRRQNMEEKSAPDKILRFGKLEIDTIQYKVSKDKSEINLTVREYELLKFLMEQSNQIFTREQLLEQVWGYEYYGDVRTVDVTVRRLREKIEDDPGHPVYIETKRGVGYYFSAK
ncbi:DNA-binding response regulator [Clostridiales bacterium COT073_COT-073]|nr:DNA-binding response regulator [Clostridiales bacterium COT073_COT-073]